MLAVVKCVKNNLWVQKKANKVCNIVLILYAQEKYFIFFHII